MMAGIRGKNTRPELLVRKYLHSKGFRYRLHDKNLPGSPDIVLRKYHLAIFVHGCFWHRHKGCKYGTTPEQNRNSWLLKFKQNTERDNKQIRLLVDEGWRVAVLWECGLKKNLLDLSWLPAYVKSGRIAYLEWPKPTRI
jgi:DNA mismatch endonuclease (patch repair protein)